MLASLTAFPAVMRVVRLGAALAALGAVGCIGRVDEERIYGPPRPAPGSRSQDVLERRGSECRVVTVLSPAVREVEIRRRIAGDGQPASPQATNAALFAMLATGIALLEYDADKLACARDASGDCWNKATTSIRPAEYVAAGVAVIPLALLTYNAIRAQNNRSIETSPEAIDPGPWHTCEEGEGPERAVERDDR
jgi:hypothetical protein